VPMEPVVIRARDGLELVCYLSRPRDSQPTTRLPMVLLVHGGPGRATYGGCTPITNGSPTGTMRC